MKLPTTGAYLKLGAATAIFGAIAAGAISFTLPQRYVSTAVMRFPPRTVAGESAWQIELDVSRHLQEMQQELLSRSSLTEIIQRPSLDLYRKERAIYPMEDVIDEMRKRDVRIERLPARAFRISFEYPDRVKAQAVVRELTARCSGHAEILTPASLPEKASQPDRLAIMGIGLGVGLAVGILFVFLRRRGLKWTLLMAGCTVAGCASAAAICLLMPETFADDQKSYQFVALGAFTGLALGAFLLRARGTGSNHYARLIAFGAACGAIAAGFVSFALPERYVSTAVMRAFPFRGAGPGAAQLEVEPAERLRQLTEDILSRSSLTDIIQRPSLDLYREERSRRPMEDIIYDVRHRDLRIAPTPPAGLTGLGPVTNFQISFEYADRDKAQAVVRELVTKFVEGNVTAVRELDRDKMSGSLAFNVTAEPKPDRDKKPGSLVLEVLDPASRPASPISPNRPAVAAIGLLAGILLGSLLALRRWLLVRQAATPGPRPSYWQYALAAAAIGALVAGLGSFAIPDRYVSTAVLRVVPFPAGDSGGAQGEIEYTARLRQLAQEILSRGSLAELIQRPSLDLYRVERRRRPMEDIIYDMRHRDLRISPTSPAGLAGPGHLTSFEISFEYADRDKAQAVVRELVSKFTEGNAAAERALHRDKMPGSLALEVLDPATLPATPVSPNRPAAAAIGLLAGMLLGSLLALRRRLVARPSAAPTVRRSAPPVASPACCWASPSHAHAAARLTQQRLDTGSRSLRALPPARSAS
jgi:capsular polysaccharide biosynthesis protein